MRCLNNGETSDRKAKEADIGSEAYRERVAKPIMSAVDSMPHEYRSLVQEFGYVDVYRAWRRGMSVDDIRSQVRDGWFAL